MKKLLFVIVIGLSILFYNSCTKDKIPVPSPCTHTDSVNTYTISVKPIFDNNCATLGCHDALTRYNGVQLDNYESSVDAAKNDAKFFCSINHTCTPEMPYLMPKLADSLIAKIEAWKTNCYAQ
jgi:hypothetical protein